MERYLKLAEFAERAQVGHSTVFQWIKGQRLREGIHDVRLGRALRFPFPQCLEAPLEEAGAARPPCAAPGSSAPPGARRPRRRRRPAGRIAVDLDWSR
ncbi:MAG: hypothetical protein Kow0092_28790 [Deferrisomatales bacterium]